MGRSKADLPHPDGGTLGESAARRLATVCSRVVFAGRPASHLSSGWDWVEDGPGRGPAAGILGAARELPGSPLLVLACDLPNVSSEVLGALAASGADWALPEIGTRLEPLAALYRPRALTELARLVASGVFALHRLRRAGELAIELFNEARLLPFGEPSDLLINLNTPGDLARWRASREA